MPTDWLALFDVSTPNPPLPAEWLPAVSASVTAPLYADERKELAARDAPDVPSWSFPSHALPDSYLAFLRWANGGTFVTGDREFGMLAAEELRRYMLDYNLPYHLPGAVPFALDGEGGFYLFDMRGPPDTRGEYPILHVPGGDLGYDEAATLGQTFEQALGGRTAVEQDRSDTESAS